MSGVSSTNSTQSVSNQDALKLKTEELKSQQKLDQTQLDQGTVQQSDQARTLLAQQGAASQMYAELQAQQLGGNGGQNAFDAAPDSVKAAANDISKRVVAQMMASIRSMATGETATSAEANAQQDESSDRQAGPGGMSSHASVNQQADEQLRNAAKSAVYRDIVEMLNTMNDRRVSKDNIRTAESTITAILARAKPGEKVTIPTYEFDERTGKLTSTGKKEMTQDEAKAEKEKLGSIRETIGDMSAQEQLILQGMMEKKSQFETMLSNVMKSTYEAGQAAVSAIKAS
jgi:hypothetical protein